MKNSLVTPWWTPAKIVRGSLAFAVGSALIYFGLDLLGVHIELFSGISYFNLTWFVGLFLLPAFSGFIVAGLYGLGGKILAYFPPVPVLAFDYYSSLHASHLPVGAQLMPLGWWGFFLILAIESAAIGGVFGEVLNKRIYRQDEEAHESSEEQ